MELIKDTAKILGVIRFDVVIFAIKEKVDPDVSQFFTALSVMDHIQRGSRIPKFVKEYCEEVHAAQELKKSVFK